MKQQTFLKPGDTIGVCAPSAQFDISKFDAGIGVLKDLGFEVKIPEKIFKKQRYLAGEDKVRADVVNQLFLDASVDGIICARGGFGAMRMLEYVDWNILKNNQKPIIGFSDTTALLLSIIDNSDIPVIHGPNLTCLHSALKETIDSFYQILTGPVKNLCVTNCQVLYSGTCYGVLKGGNLATISHLVGTPFAPNFDQCLVFLEETNEPAYKIDRMLSQMKMAGLFEGIQGVITGSFDACDNKDYIFQILLETFKEYDIPVLFGLPAGHGSINLSLSMGHQVQMDTEALTLVWDTPQ